MSDMLPAAPVAPGLPAPVPSASLEPRPKLNLPGRKKAAVLLVSLGPDRAAEVFKHLKEEEIEGLSLEMAKTRQVPMDTSEAIWAELVETVMAEAYVAEGGVEYARMVLERSLGPDRANELIGRLSATIERRPFEFLRRSSPEQIHAFLRNEAPQTIAVVIANLHTTLAAEVLSQLEPGQQAEVALRVGTMTEISPDVTRDVEAVLRQKLSNVVTQEYSSAGGVRSLADILNNSDRTTERNVLDSLAERYSELAEEVRMLLFTFEDIVKLDDRSIQMVLKEVDAKDLGLALRGVNDETKERIFKNMSERGAEMLREEMEFQPAQKRSVVEEAQGRIVGVIRRLEESGEIVIARGGGGEEDQML
jgi:flagellar motor switch protein FliG